MTESKLTFIPPTSPESEDVLAHLRPEINSDDMMYDIDPFALFHDIGEGLIATEEITAEELVVGMQILSGRTLNTQGLRNLLGWAQESIRRKEAKTDPEWNSLNQSERVRILFGVEIDFGEPAKEERVAV